MKKRNLCTITAALSLLSFSSSTHAAVLVTIEDSGSDVVVTAAGNLDLTGATFQSTSTIAGVVFAPGADIQISNSSGLNVDGYTTVIGPVSWGSGPLSLADSFSGTPFSVIGGNGGSFSVPQGYTSGGALNATMTFNGETVNSLGLNPGIYQYTIPSGDTITVDIVPEPGSSLLLALGVMTVALSRRRRVA